jgi:hypothetical protein
MKGAPMKGVSGVFSIVQWRHLTGVGLEEKRALPDWLRR